VEKVPGHGGDFTVQKLLEDDDSVKYLVQLQLGRTALSLRKIVAAVDLVDVLQSKLLKTITPWPDIYIKAMSYRLDKYSSIRKDVMSSLKTASSQVLKDILDNVLLSFKMPSDASHCRAELDKLLSSIPNVEATPLRSGHDMQHSNLRTTIVAQKVELRKQAATLTPEETTYTKILDRVLYCLDSYFDLHLQNPQDLVFHEILIYDFKIPHRESFSPRPRFALERALSCPHDYLDCECCSDAAVGLSASQPATAVLYQLYLESGGLINTADLWSAFWTIMGAEEEEGEESEDEKERAL